ncbi:MAG: hypothetical protein HKM94_00705 [Halobacteria archaeon]|nr:hypothetical protein [Halobacteria archaeon]
MKLFNLPIAVVAGSVLAISVSQASTNDQSVINWAGCGITQKAFTAKPSLTW